MSLRSGSSFWQTLGPPPLAAEPVAGNVSCDVAILGGGITGALVADRLTGEGVDAVLLDKRPLGTGSTAASTGLLQYEIDTPLVDLVEMVGEARAVHAYRRGLTAIDEIEQLVGELDDPCGFARRESLYFASHFWHVRRLRREYECRRRNGFAIELLDAAALGQISTIRARAALRSTGDAQINPYRLTQRLLARASQRGLRCWAPSEVLSIDEKGGRVRLTTAQGTLSARRIVYATGYDSRRYWPDDPGSLHCTYAAVSEPLASFTGWPRGMLIWETARPYFYARQTEDGRAMIGGADSAFASDHKRDGLIERRVASIVRRFKRLFPDIPLEPAYGWAGTFGESPDGMPYIGQPPGRDNAYFAIGYGGNGITFSTIASRLISDLCLGRANADADVFGFDR
ncbi:MAG TPA: FAD-binding oxidoreductase [Pirellulales bacterium]|jgi:glycine/D-amino acid oxidase-like deaminating enzyme|nr:FAD-binding oxidoreductase [Pirellulales bacterium]